MQARPKLLYPSMVIAAISVTVFSLLGAATLTGALPLAHSETGDSAAQATQAGGPAATACRNCGTVESIRLVETKGQASGMGAVAGGVAGALVGNQMGRGNGRTAMTLLGGAGGAYAGNEIEKNTHKSASYRIRVRMEDGSERSFHQHEAPAFTRGDRVKIVSGALLRQS